MKKINAAFFKKVGTVCLLLVGIYCTGVIAVSVVSDHLKYTSPVYSYDSGYDDREPGEEIITTEHFAHNYAVFVFNRCYRPDARYEDYDLQWMARDQNHGVWQALFSDEGVLRAGSEVVMEFGYDGQLLAASGLFEPGDRCNYIVSREMAKEFGETLFYHLYKDNVYMLELDGYWLSGSGKKEWDMGYYKRGWLGGGRGFRFCPDGKLIEFYVSE